MSLDNIELHISKPQEITPQRRLSAQKTICHYSQDADEAAQVMLMLGIYPNQEKL